MVTLPPPALTVLRPSARPVTRPIRPLPVALNWLVTSLPLRRTLSTLAAMPGGGSTSTRASPPLIRSARLESTLIMAAPAPPLTVELLPQATTTAATMKMTAILMDKPTSPPPSAPCAALDCL